MTTGTETALMMAFLGVLALVLSYAGVGSLRHWAESRQMLDIPNERSSHTRPTPRGGGLLIVVISTLGLAVTWLFRPALSPAGMIGYLIGASLIAGISWRDDLRSVPNRVRFAAHSLGALLILLGFGYWNVVELPLIGVLPLGWPGLVLAFLWIVGLTNAYNFMDGIDGIAGGQAVVAGAGWAVLGWLVNQPLVGVIGLLLAATSLGFLGHNWPPARIFMGDVGSAFLGYTFAIIPVIAAQHNPRLFLAGVLLVWPFVFDAAFTFIRRLRNGENIFAAHRSHLYQRLVIAGFSHRFVSLLYIALAVIGTLLAVGWTLEITATGPAIMITIPSLCLALWALVVRAERTTASNHQQHQ